MGNTINEVGSWLNANVWRPVEKGLFNYQENVDKYVGQVVNWNPAEITVSDRAAATLTLFAATPPFACEQQEESSKSAEDISQSKDVVAEVSQKPSGIAFCSKTGVVEADDDCHLKGDVKDKMSSCVYLTNVMFSDKSKLTCFDSGYQQPFPLDFDELMSILLSKEGCLGVDFIGDKTWPMSWFSEYYQPDWGLLVLQKLPVENEWSPHSLTSEQMKIIPNKDTWSAQVWFRQSPALCWAVYETPCADESVCE